MLAAVQVGAASIATLRQAGAEWVLSARDQPFTPSGVAGRLVRAHRNLLEVLPQFVASVVLVYAADSVSPLTGIGTWTFLIARILYVPAYVSAIPWLRPFCWQVAFAGILCIVVDGFLP